MNQLYLFIIILIFVLFLMYVYKKKCDEDYYINLIQFIQQQNQYSIPCQTRNNIYPGYPHAINMDNQTNYFPAYNQIKDDNMYKTPKRKKTLEIYKNFSSLNNSPSPNINFTNDNYNKEKNFLNNLKNNQNGGFYNDDLRKNTKNVINKKIFKLEDFLTDSKIKNLNNDINIQ